MAQGQILAQPASARVAVAEPAVSSACVKPASERITHRIAVVSPFLDKSHGTERRVSELVERLARDFRYEVHIYSQNVRDISNVERAALGNGSRACSIVWHKVPDIPGPHLVKYVWWFAANHLWRWSDGWLHGRRYELTYTPGINCFDADVVSIHIVFAEFYRQVQSELRLRINPWRSWPRLVHRRLYYYLIIALEHLIYPRRDLRLAAISRKTADDLNRLRKHRDAVPVIYGGLDFSRFSPERRLELRSEARQSAGLADSDFALLLVGNDWKKKGLHSILDALALLENRDRVAEPSGHALKLIIAGQDSLAPYRSVIDRHQLGRHLIFMPVRSDVEFYYAAADAYVGPSLEDAFAFPPFEAMACGLPVIVSGQAGVSELVTHGVDGFVLDDPRDSRGLARLLVALWGDPELRRRMGENASRTARQYTWERNAEQFQDIFEAIFRSKAHV